MRPFDWLGPVIRCQVRRSNFQMPAPSPDDQFNLLRDYTHHILVSHDMTQADPLRNMPRTSSPYQGVLERILQGPVDLIAYVLNG